MSDRNLESGPNLESLPFNPEDYSLKEILKPEHTALLVIDMQNDFLSDKGFFAKRPEVPGSIEQMQGTVKHIQSLIRAAHKAKVPVIFTKGYEDVSLRKPGPDLRRAVKWQENDADPGSINSKKGTWGAELYEGMEPEEGDIIVEKTKWSAFSGKDKDGKTLKAILDKLGIKTLVTTGVVAETCVETTIRDAYDQDYFVVIPKNGVGSNQEDQLKARMSYWSQGFIGDVLDESEIEEAWTTDKQKALDE